MNLALKSSGTSFEIDLSVHHDISIPLRFDGPQPNLFGVAKARSESLVQRGLIGDTRKGGSCNFERYEMTPHCNGTHTECVGHITDARISVRDCLRDAFFSAALISVEPETAAGSRESYSMEFGDSDLVITSGSLEKCIEPFGAAIPDGLIVRTLPNGENKLSEIYEKRIPPFFTTEATEMITGYGIKHLIADLPSIDRIYDLGRLSNHRIFWNMEDTAHEIGSETRIESTITELVFVPNNVEDGLYGTNLQIAPFDTDASPSRPLLFPARE